MNYKDIFTEIPFFCNKNYVLYKNDYTNEMSAQWIVFGATEDSLDILIYQLGYKLRVDTFNVTVDGKSKEFRLGQKTDIETAKKAWDRLVLAKFSRCRNSEKYLDDLYKPCNLHTGV
jgi:hypothetical protein